MSSLLTCSTDSTFGLFTPGPEGPGFQGFSLVGKDSKLKKQQLGGSLGWDIAGSKAEGDDGRGGALRELDMALSLLARVSRALWGSTFH